MKPNQRVLDIQVFVRNIYILKQSEKGYSNIDNATTDHVDYWNRRVYLVKVQAARFAHFGHQVRSVLQLNLNPSNISSCLTCMTLVILFSLHRYKKKDEGSYEIGGGYYTPGSKGAYWTKPSSLLRKKCQQNNLAHVYFINFFFVTTHISILIFLAVIVAQQQNAFTKYTLLYIAPNKKPTFVTLYKQTGLIYTFYTHTLNYTSIYQKTKKE